MALPGDVAMPLEQLRQAVPGLAGLVGLLLFPTITSWIKLLLEYLEWNSPGLGRPKGISGFSIMRALGLSLGLGFFLLTWFRAAGELRDVQAEAPVVGPSIQGILVGVAFWALYAIGLSALRSDVRRRRNEHRMGRSLR
jgi:hypothetical protein